MKIGPQAHRTSAISTSSHATVVVRGHDLAGELIGNINFTDYFWLLLTGAVPSAAQRRVLDATLVAIAEHGLVPSVQASRMTLAAAPEALQGAVAAGLLGLGDRYGGSVEGVARMLQEAGGEDEPSVSARGIVDAHRKRKQPVPGLGHPIHKPIDPRVPRLFAIAADNGLSGWYVHLMEAVADEAGRAYNRGLPVNATGAIGAILSELGMPWRVTRGVAVMARAIGLVAHLQEELEEPLANEIWTRVEEESSEHNRPH